MWACVMESMKSFICSDSKGMAVSSVYICVNELSIFQFKVSPKFTSFPSLYTTNKQIYRKVN